ELRGCDSLGGILAAYSSAPLFTAMPRPKPSMLGPKSRATVDSSHRRVEGVYLKLILWGLIGIILLVAFFWGGHSGYVRWQERRLVRRALTALANGDA